MSISKSITFTSLLGPMIPTCDVHFYVLGYLVIIFTLYRIALAPPRKQAYRIGLLFTHRNTCGCTISVTKRSCAEPISKVKCHISDRFCSILWCSGNTYSARRGSK